MFAALRRLLRDLLPEPVRRLLTTWLNGRRRRLMAPRMLLGYRDRSGEWRPNTRISDTAAMYCPENISIADNVYVGHYTVLDGSGPLYISEGVQIAAQAAVITHSSHIAIRLYGRHYQEIGEKAKLGYPIKAVRIGRYAFIGAGAKVLPGVSIGDGAVVAAGAVVGHDVGDHEIVSGNPAVVIGDTRKVDAQYLRDPQLRTWYDEWQEN